MSNRLPMLAAEIRRAHADVQEAAKTAAEHAIAAGHALIEAKALVGHGGWLPWLREHCALAERTAQLYMKIARSGHSAETVSALGLKGAEQSLMLQYGYFQPLHDGDDEARRDWLIFAHFLVDRLGYRAEGAALHIDWLGRHDFKTVQEWLTEGPKWVATWGSKIDVTPEQVATFGAQYEGFSVNELMATLESKAADVPPPSRQRRKTKSATVADLGGAA